MRQMMSGMNKNAENVWRLGKKNDKKSYGSSNENDEKI